MLCQWAVPLTPWLPYLKNWKDQSHIKRSVICKISLYAFAQYTGRHKWQSYKRDLCDQVHCGHSSSTSTWLFCSCWKRILGAVLAFDEFHSFPRKGENSVSVPSFCWWANTRSICSSGCLRAHPGSLVAELLEGWRCSQLPSPTWSSNGPVPWLFSRSLHSPTLLKLGWVDFRVKHYLLGPAQLSPALSTLIKQNLLSSWGHAHNYSTNHHWAGVHFPLPFYFHLSWILSTIITSKALRKSNKQYLAVYSQMALFWLIWSFSGAGPQMSI